MLEIKDISCGYSARFSLKNIKFNVQEKQIVGIIGPNGSGKTTLLRAITKVLPLDTGTIAFNQNDISRMSYKQLAQNIAVVSNDIEYNFEINVEDFVALGRIPHQSPFQFFEDAEDKKIVEQALAMTELTGFAQRSLAELSAGERQMAIIAKALAQKPKLLLLDEPIVHLDISHQVYIMNLLRRLNKQHDLSVIIVLHELNFAAEYCDQLVLMDKGKVYTIGTPEQVLNKQTVESVYQTKVMVSKNPISQKPHVFIVSAEEEKNGQ
ncbi:MAG: ABC transporter ATP-binding protein [Candidatus Omnitrophica bacterium]|nr:ABC transporter ATP-binding protein [Candidatus Omnitrophota bacterium]